ncbi:hypothetical protein HY631_02120 [Candidatus Uhrbacteria bacterium]|nr:hypothetical protein [Candidatus Uhrbacteria bacterium]
MSAFETMIETGPPQGRQRAAGQEAPEHFMSVEQLEAEAGRIVDLATAHARDIQAQQEKRLLEELKRMEVLPGTRTFDGALERYRGSNTFEWFHQKFNTLGKWLVMVGLSASVERAIPSSPDLGTMANRDEAAEQLKKTGITAEREQAYIPGVSEAVYRVVVPYGSIEDLSELLRVMPETALHGREEVTFRTPEGEEWTVKQNEQPEREDAFRLFLGMPQKNDTFGVSEYQPQGSDDLYYYRINGFIETLAEEYPDSYSKPIKVMVQDIEATVSDRERRWQDDDLYVYEPHPHDKRSVIASGDKIMGHFTLSLGRDEKGEYVSYYDRWDFGQPGEKGEGLMALTEGLVGKPFEIYDRVYFDRATWEVREP